MSGVVGHVLTAVSFEVVPRLRLVRYALVMAPSKAASGKRFRPVVDRLRAWLKHPGTTVVFRRVILLVAVFEIGYLSFLALNTPPDDRTRNNRFRDGLWDWVRWFGEPNSLPSTLVVVATIVLACVLAYRARAVTRDKTVPIVVVVGLLGVCAVLGFSSFFRCGNKATSVFSPILWTTWLMKGNIDDRTFENGARCPAATPVALDVARFAAVGALAVAVVSAALITILQVQADKFSVFFAKRLTIVIGIDDDTESIIRQVASSLEGRSRLLLLTSVPDRPCVKKARAAGARVIAADLDLQDLRRMRCWKKIESLYILSPDPAANLARLSESPPSSGSYKGSAGYRWSSGSMTRGRRRRFAPNIVAAMMTTSGLPM
ncbi:hypothetical protein SMNI109538_06330 [Smaragdicoccus niigatensis]